jgi:hypothetical protein
LTETRPPTKINKGSGNIDVKSVRIMKIEHNMSECWACRIFSNLSLEIQGDSVIYEQEIDCAASLRPQNLLGHIGTLDLDLTT